MDAHRAAKAHYQVKKLLYQLNGLVVQTLAYRKVLLKTKQEFDNLVIAAELNSFTQAVYRERFRRGLAIIDRNLHRLYVQRERARQELGKLI